MDVTSVLTLSVIRYQVTGKVLSKVEKLFTLGNCHRSFVVAKDSNLQFCRPKRAGLAGTNDR